MATLLFAYILKSELEHAAWLRLSRTSLLKKMFCCICQRRYFSGNFQVRKYCLVFLYNRIETCTCMYNIRNFLNIFKFHILKFYPCGQYLKLFPNCFPIVSHNSLSKPRVLSSCQVYPTP